MGSLRNGVIEPEVRVAVVLRMVSGASYLYDMVIWKIANSSVLQNFEETTSVLLEALPSIVFRRI